MRLDPDPVVLVLRRAPPAQLGQDLAGVGQPLGQHGPHRVARPDVQLLHRGQSAADQRGGDQSYVAADVVGALQHLPLGPPARVDLGQRVQDGGRADAQPQVPGDQAEQVPGLQRGGPAEQPGQQLQLAPLRALPLRRGDLAQGVHHGGDLQAGRPIGRRLVQQLLGRLAQIAGLPYAQRDQGGLGTGGGAERPDRQLLGQSQVDPGELRRDLPLAQVADGRQQLGRSLRHQLRHPLDQHEPAAGLLQVTVGLGHDQVPHRCPLSLT